MKKMETFDFQEAKKEYIENIKRYMSETGSLFPHISIFGVDKNNSKKSIVHVPIPDEFLKSSDKKDEFMDDILPAIAKEVNKKFTTYAVGWASEAWMSVLDNPTLKTDSKRKEVLFITIGYAEGEDASVFDIHRTGKQVNQEGELTDIIELVEVTKMSGTDISPVKGRFSNLYQKFKELE